ncbi:FERM domain-containing protein 6 [Merluccius polli]|uniref:FERM domain-containing protein 6 n=1 Tax=Merluccius polli TaxID=89951 RepID=A0AA47N1I8_MERPO|nr:FERM domain-containing protein 6 [Merluccius polli]
MSVLAKQERTICVLLPNKEQLDVTIGLKSTGLDVFNHVAELLGIKELHFFGLTVVKDNEHIFLDMEEKLTKYFPKESKPDSLKGLPKKPLPLVLFLKVQYYVENGRLICERKARHLYYSDLRERVLRSECRQQEEVYFQLAGYALQADLGDHPPLEEDQGGGPRFQPKDYFPPWIVAKREVNYLLCHGPKVHRELWGMSVRDAILLFIKESCRLEDVPVTFYRLQKDKKEERGTALLGLTLRGMQVYQEMNNLRQMLYDFPWYNVGRLTFLGKRFEIQPDGLPSARKLVYYTGSPFRSRHLLLHLSSCHRLYLSLQPALKHLRQLEDTEDKKRYRESYISDDLETDPQGSPRLSRHSTCSSGIEVDARHHGSVSMEMASMETAVSVERGAGRRRAEKCFSSAASHGSSHTSGVDVGGVKARADEEDEEECPEEELKVSRTEEVLVHDHGDMFHLADLLQGMSVDFSLPTSDIVHLDSKGYPSNSNKKTAQLHKDTLAQVLQSRGPICVDRHSQSLDDVRLFPPPKPLGTALLPDSSLSCTFELPDPHVNPKGPSSADPHAYYPPVHRQAKPSFYGRRAPNCMSLDLLGEEQLLEFIL